MNSKDFIEMVKAKHGLPSNYAAARLLGMSDSRISAYVKGRREFDDKACIAVAKALELPETYVLASLQAERAKDSSVKVIWENLAETIKKSHAFAVIVLLGVLAWPPIRRRRRRTLQNHLTIQPSIHYTHIRR